MRMSKFSLRFYATGLAACALLACEKPNGNGNGDGEEGEVTAETCKKQIAARQDELTAAGVDVANWSFHDAPEMVEPALTARRRPTPTSSTTASTAR